MNDLWCYDQQWEYCEEIKDPNFIYIKIAQHSKKDYKVNYIPFLLPRLVFNINKVAFGITGSIVLVFLYQVLNKYKVM